MRALVRKVVDHWVGRWDRQRADLRSFVEAIAKDAATKAAALERANTLTALDVWGRQSIEAGDVGAATALGAATVMIRRGEHDKETP